MLVTNLKQSRMELMHEIKNDLQNH